VNARGSQAILLPGARLFSDRHYQLIESAIDPLELEIVRSGMSGHPGASAVGSKRPRPRSTSGGPKKVTGAKPAPPMPPPPASKRRREAAAPSGKDAASVCEYVSMALMDPDNRTGPTELETAHPLVPSHFLAPPTSAEAVAATAAAVGEDISAFIKSVVPGWKRLVKAPKSHPGHPAVLIVCPGARRCVELLPSLSRTFGVRVEKLFAKHMDVHEQAANLATYSAPFAIGE